MNRILLTAFSLLVIVAVLVAKPTAGQRPYVPVVLISVDGLKPDYLLEADKHGLKIPNLRRLLAEGAYAMGVTGILPTVTYPSHTTMVTGVAPIKHGIHANAPFDPFGKNQGGWMWYTEDIKALTLWDAAEQAGLTTASVDWPVTVGANITYNIPQIWRASTPDDRKLVRALATKGLLDEIERAVGNYVDGYDYTLVGEGRRARFNAYLIETKKPHLHLAYFSALDEEQHAKGPYAKSVFETLEELDRMIGEVRAAALKAGNGRAYVAVVSDHGFFRIQKDIRLNYALKEAGLLELDAQGKLKTWRAICRTSGGVTAIMLRDAQDAEAKEKVRALLQRLAADSATGIHRVIEQAEAQKMGGFPDAAFVVGAKAEFYFSGSFEAPVVANRRVGGGHGFLAEFADMNSTFIIAGPGIPARKNLGQMDMRDIAPTLAALLGIKLPDADGHNVLHP